jgi:hypothetical protein
MFGRGGIATQSMGGFLPAALLNSSVLTALSVPV